MTSEPATGRHRSTMPRPRLRRLPLFLVRLTGLQLALLIAGATVIGSGLWQGHAFAERPPLMRPCSFATVTDVLHSPVGWRGPRLGLIRLDWNGDSELAWASNTYYVFRPGEKIRVCGTPGDFVALNGEVYAAHWLVGATSFEVIFFGCLPLTLMIIFSVVQWKDDEEAQYYVRVGRRRDSPPER
ncbi:MAG: hypothetical protein HOV83_23930 [Catenulispora sp.]|nr:hypothetical protein [Catenulispora sp.]